MKKKFIPVLSALMVLAMGTTAFAAGSPTTSDVVTEVTPSTTQEAAVAEVASVSAEESVKVVDGTAGTMKNGDKAEVTIAQVAETTVASAAAQVKENLKNVAALAEAIGSDGLKAAATDSGATIKPAVKAVVNVTVPNVSAANPVTLTFPVAGITADSTVFVLHFNGTSWETIRATAGAGTVTATFTSLSPIAIVELAVETAGGVVYPNGWDKATWDLYWSSSRNTNTATAAAAADTAAVTSPKTGEGASVLPVLALAGMAGIAVCGKKVRFNR